MACAVAMEALQVLKDEKMAENAEKLGIQFRAALEELQSKTDKIVLVRGKGLLNAVVINDNEDSHAAWDICVKMAEMGLLAKPTHGNIIRFAPPLCITEDEIKTALDIISTAILEN